ncbi:DNA-binding transcriptional ArsR family regulator [Arcanobacterium wilhelmae]|uniref:DNA-binding transcriptional ArsR family regulator n=1 Tax=Arcanobacterium wilhelmae TaxID=1803177 RepID=A0ABT9NAT5_9ACTO|nr:winged helix-turn-helix domain-containing protein [Arcanobacterium wilhelmae]MDP9800829.1 DNA-binding transcriptional ArsR family regulator [Arcanobacterium wilhelmae]WFN90203.1 winged helix-turn-helix domain-containing protein [Arcanobacterium wilhelmae]
MSFNLGYPRAYDGVDPTPSESARSEVAKLVVDSLQVPVATAITMIENQSVLLDAMREELEELRKELAQRPPATSVVTEEGQPESIAGSTSASLPTATGQPGVAGARRTLASAGAGHTGAPASAGSEFAETPQPATDSQSAPLNVFPQNPQPHSVPATHRPPRAAAAGPALATAFRSLDGKKVSEDLTALAHPIRLEILEFTAERAMTVRDLVEALSTGTTGQVYHHMKALTAAGWVEAEGGEYRVAPERAPQLAAILAALR